MEFQHQSAATEQLLETVIDEIRSLRSRLAEDASEQRALLKAIRQELIEANQHLSNLESNTS